MALIPLLRSKRLINGPLRELLKKIYFHGRYLLFSDEREVVRGYVKVFGVAPDLTNPKTLNEKIQWLKLNDFKPLYTLCADKFRVREYVARIIGDMFLVPLIAALTNVDDLDPAALPDSPFILKTNCGSGDYLIVRDKSSVNWSRVKKRFKVMLQTNHYHQRREKQYRDIPPMLLVETLLQDSHGKVPPDIKVHCFNGEPAFIYVTSDREGDTKRNLYTTEWEELPFVWSNFDRNGKPEYVPGAKIEKPRNLSQLLDTARALARDFSDTYVRVDLYNVDQSRIYFGELTLHHMSGLAEIRPKEWDLKLGEMLQLPMR
jgi:hypothetical protein